MPPRKTKEPKISVIPAQNAITDKKIQSMRNRDILPEIPTNIMLLGRCKSGKSSMLYSLLTDMLVYGKNKKSVFDEMIIYLGTQDSIHAFESINCKNKIILHDFDGLDFEQYLNDLKVSQMEKIEKGKKPLNVCIVFDDFVGEGALKPTKNGKAPILQRLALTSRHECNATIIMASQSYKSNGLANPALRNNIHYYIMYALARNDLEKIIEEHQGFYEKDELMDHFLKVYQEPYKFIMINYNKPEHLRYTEGFTKLLPPPKSMEKSLVFKRVDDDASSVSSLELENDKVK